jgi:hypothetical protein
MGKGMAPGLLADRSAPLVGGHSNDQKQVIIDGLSAAISRLGAAGLLHGPMA